MESNITMKSHENSNLDCIKSLKLIHSNLLNFPRTLKKGLLDFNIHKMYIKISKAEEKILFQDKELLKKASEISIEYGNLAGDINEDLADFESIMNKMKKMDVEASNLNGFYKAYTFQWCLSVKALWYYKNNDFKNAVQLTKKCIDIIDDFIELGFNSLIFRNIEQNKNLGFILKKTKKESEQQKLNGDILNYYFSGKTETLYGRYFNNERVWNELPYLRDSFGYLTFKQNVEKYYDLLKIDRKKAETFYRNILEKIVYCEPTTLERYNIHVWLKIQDSFYKKSYKTFLSEMEEFFNEEKEIFYDIFKKVLINQYLFLIDSFIINKSEKETMINETIKYEFQKLSNYRTEDFTGVIRKAKIE